MEIYSTGCKCRITDFVDIVFLDYLGRYLQHPSVPGRPMPGHRLKPDTGVSHVYKGTIDGYLCTYGALFLPPSQ